MLCRVDIAAILLLDLAQPSLRGGASRKAVGQRLRLCLGVCAASLRLARKLLPLCGGSQAAEAIQRGNHLAGLLRTLRVLAMTRGRMVIARRVAPWQSWQARGACHRSLLRKLHPACRASSDGLLAPSPGAHKPPPAACRWLTANSTLLVKPLARTTAQRWRVELRSLLRKRYALSPQTPGRSARWARSANIKDDSSATGVRLVQSCSTLAR